LQKHLHILVSGQLATDNRTTAPVKCSCKYGFLVSTPIRLACMPKPKVQHFSMLWLAMVRYMGF